MAADLNAAQFNAEPDDVFARIARRYDLLCDLFSLGAHRLWKAHMARRISEQPGGALLDVASGTGDIPLRILKRGLKRPAVVFVTDLSPSMLAVAQEKIDPETVGLHYVIADAHDLRAFETSSIDLFSISFGMKICDRSKVMAEAFRVLKPGGRFFCLEAARIPNAPIHALYLRYMAWCLPLIARLAVDGDPSAYDYLLRGIREFPDQQSLCEELRAAGFIEARFENLTFGIVALHRAAKP